MNTSPGGLPVDDITSGRDILVVCGSGGVGKTTVAASLAVRAAQRGRRVVVCTIDPARRLADSLGLDPARRGLVEVAGVGAAGGALSAMMLDSKATFDALVRRYARSPEAAEGILSNAIYARISSQVGGTQEYMAMEMLHSLVEDGGAELIVLDTPPTRHALDFLEAPERMARVLDHSTLQWLLGSGSGAGRFSFGLVKRGFRKVVDKLDEIFGMKVLNDIVEFFRAFDGMYDGFLERSRRVAELLRADRTAFVVVSSPEQNPLAEAAALMDELGRRALPLRALILNRCHLPLPGPTIVPEPDLHPGLACPALAALARYQRLARDDELRVRAALPGERAGLDVYRAPRFSVGLCDVAGLETLSSRIMPFRRSGGDE
jgi:anion-transporting  ArsA/GET3 family ATPase